MTRPRSVRRIARGIRNRVRSANNERILRAARLSDFTPASALVTSVTDVRSPIVPAVDFHNHLGYWLNGDRWLVPDVPELLSVMDELSVSAMVNLDGRWGIELERNLDRYDRAYPGRFATFAHVDWSKLAEPGGAADLPGLVRQAKDAGAVGIKVWKDLGLHVRDHQQRLVLPDDERLSPVWEEAGALGLPVLIHTADPVAFWAPADRHNERFEELARHPDWRFGDEARFPSYQRLMAAFEHVVAEHPATTFVGAHVASQAEDLAQVGRLLATYRNLYVDLAARESEIGRQPRAARAFIVAHADRVLFGTDCFPVDPRTYRIWFRLLESADEYFPYSVADPPERGRWSVSGLDLDATTLNLLYADNAHRLIPSWSANP